MGGEGRGGRGEGRDRRPLPPRFSAGYRPGECNNSISVDNEIIN